MTQNAAAMQTRGGTHRHLAFWALMGSGLVWGGVWWPLQYFADAGLTGHAIGLTAYAAVALASAPIIWRERYAWRGEGGWLLLISLCFGCTNMAFTAALMTGSVVRVMLLFYLLPVWGAFGGWLFLRERIGPLRLLAIVLSMTGVFVIMGGVQALDAPVSAADGLALASGFFYAAAGICNRKAVRIPVASRTLSAFGGCVAVALVILPISVPTFPVLSMLTWGFLLAFAFIWLLGGTLLTTYGVTHVATSRATVLQVVELLVAVGSAVLIGGEVMGSKEWIGGALIITATLVEANNTEDLNTLRQAT